VAIFEDVSQIEKVTGELKEVKELEERLQLILDSVQDEICVLDKDGFITYVNSSYLNILKQSKEKV
jgi:PAS domain-containing protein